MNNLSGCYRQLGRHQDSLVMAEKALEFRRRVLISLDFIYCPSAFCAATRLIANAPFFAQWHHRGHRGAVSAKALMLDFAEGIRSFVNALNQITQPLAAVPLDLVQALREY